MVRRTTIEIDEELLARAKRALGATTMRGTVEEALRRAADAAEDETAQSAAKQVGYLGRLSMHADLDVLSGEGMWR
jgi:Arc/MetJ family transcription regulator